MKYLVLLIAFIFRLNIVVNSHQIEFPVEVCTVGLTTGNYLPCVTKLAHAIYRLHSWSEDTPIDICGINCKGNLKGRVSKWKWKWDGRFRCDSIAPGIVGRDTKQSRDGAMEWAIKDFINKAIASGQFKIEKFQC